MPTGKDASPQQGDPLLVYNFSVEISGIIEGYFTEVSGLGSESDVTEHKIVGKGGKEAVRKVPGRLKWGDITLKRGMTANMDMWKWRKMVEDGKVDSARKDGSVVMYSTEGQEVARWNFVRGWPSKVSSPSGNAGSSDIGLEELTIVHEGIERIT